ncbi:MAG: beta-ketoacyl synthase N-terminal-like domain-containing protein [Lewinella sp.]|nr:beta-ketoacyl synthase N-terminal-like domain-containing protein [Lewinella sp.]
MKINIHGYGSISAAGNSPAAAWETYIQGKPTWSTDLLTGMPVYRIKQLPNDPGIKAFAGQTEPDRATVLALHAADQAVQQAGWAGKDFSIIVGCSRGPTESWEEGFSHYLKKGVTRLRTSPKTTLGSIGFALADYFGTDSPASSMSMTCSSGMHAILHGIALLKSGMAERVLVGGSEAPITPFTLGQMEALRIYGKVAGVGEHACRPFSDPPSGMVMGEGAAFLALSLEEDSTCTHTYVQGIAFARESTPTPTGISAEGQALEKAMHELVEKFGCPDVIVAHAPGTKRGDRAELNAINALYATIPDDYCTTSFKWATGHTFGASGPLAITAALEMMKAGKYCPLPWQATPKTAWPSGRVLVNATGFGGNVASIMVAQTRDAGGGF